MNRMYLRIFIGVTCCLFYYTSLADNNVVVTSANYSFKIPKQWSRAASSDERQIIDTTSKATAGYAKHGSFYVFNTPDEYMVIVYELEFVGRKPSLKEVVSTNRNNFGIGISRGIVKDVLSNNIISLGDINALENDWIGTTRKKNNRNLAYIINTPNEKVNINVSAFFASSDNAFSNEVKEIVKSLRF